MQIPYCNFFLQTCNCIVDLTDCVIPDKFFEECLHWYIFELSFHNNNSCTGLSYKVGWYHHFMGEERVLVEWFNIYTCRSANDVAEHQVSSEAKEKDDTVEKSGRLPGFKKYDSNHYFFRILLSWQNIKIEMKMSCVGENAISRLHNNLFLNLGLRCGSIITSDGISFWSWNSKLESKVSLKLDLKKNLIILIRDQ